MQVLQESLGKLEMGFISTICQGRMVTCSSPFPGKKKKMIGMGVLNYHHFLGRTGLR